VTSGVHPFVLADSESELLRKVELPPCVDLPAPNQYQVPDLATVDLSFAGRLSNSSPVLGAISASAVGDPISLQNRDGKWMILDTGGQVLGRMAGSWAPPVGGSFVSGKIGAIVRWRKSDNDERFQAFIKREEWETVLPELVFGVDVSRSSKRP
jgi:ATP-dependent DNA helicase RecQ